MRTYTPFVLVSALPASLDRAPTPPARRRWPPRRSCCLPLRLARAPCRSPLSDQCRLTTWRRVRGSAALAETDSDAAPNNTFKLIKLIRMARFLKLIRLLKAAKIFRIFEEELGKCVRT